MKTSKAKILNGVVVSNKMKDTVVVAVNRFTKNKKYGKYIQITSKQKAHAPGNSLNIGDKVEIQETRPISKDKRYIVLNK